MKRALAVITTVAVLGGLAGGLTAAFAFNGNAEEAGSPESASKAMEIAQNSTCMLDGWFTGDAFYNESTGTWWFDLDIEKEGCSPACVVNVKTGEAEINWRCTGVIPSEEDKIRVGVPLIPGTPLPNGVGMPKESAH